MEKLRLIELCSGIGAQYVGLKTNNLFDIESIGTADLDKEVIVSYAAMHCGLTKELIESFQGYPSKEKMIKDLTEKGLGYDFKQDKSYDWSRLAKKKNKFLGIEKYWLADKLSKNYGDITRLKHLEACDFLTYSTPCQSLSAAGRQEGLGWTCMDCQKTYDPASLDVADRYTCPNCGSHNIKSTRSGLLYEVERLLVDAKDNSKLPKYLFMENVDALVSSKYIDSFNDWLNRLANLGYNNYYKCINAKDVGIPQNRNRIFCLSIRKDIDTGKFEFPKPFDSGLRLRDVLETDEKVLEKYFLKDEFQQRLQLNLKVKEDKNKTRVVRRLTPKECHRLMGFSDELYERCREVGISESQAYKQAGNSIVTNVIALIVQHLYKAQYDENYECEDEKYYNEG